MLKRISCYVVVTLVVTLLLTLAGPAHAQQSDCGGPAPAAGNKGNSKPKNVIFILVDDLRYDVFGFMGHPFIKTPHIDALARGGVHFKNAFVTTALCSPSRASILTGQYMHRHKVIDNNVRPPAGTVYFSEHLKRAGYNTAFIGKWHMGGEHDDPQPGFDHWISFRGQGHYRSPNDKWTLNVNGQRVPQRGYITDELTDYALEWLDQVKPTPAAQPDGSAEDKRRDNRSPKPYFLYLSHKAVHADFHPAERHKDLYSDVKIELPPSTADTPENYRGKPMWVKNQRNSWHGVDFPYHSRLDVTEYFRQYCRTLAAVDDSVGRVMQWLAANNLADDTVVMFMGDNGFLFGEHGLIDKRNAYEESIRVPLIAHCPSLFKPGTTVESVVANIDIAPSVLEMAGVEVRSAGDNGGEPRRDGGHGEGTEDDRGKDRVAKIADGVADDRELAERIVIDGRTYAGMDGRSFVGLGTGAIDPKDWRSELLYEYYWEWNFPHTPTMFALRGDRFKYIQYHGIWDTDELYDLKSDPKEMNNLIRDRAYQDTMREMRRELHEVLSNTRGAQIPLGRKQGPGESLRSRQGSKAAEFPEEVIRE